MTYSAQRSKRTMKGVLNRIRCTAMLICVEGHFLTALLLGPKRPNPFKESGTRYHKVPRRKPGSLPGLGEFGIRRRRCRRSARPQKVPKTDPRIDVQSR